MMLMLDRSRKMNSGSKLGATRLTYRHLRSLVAGNCSLEALLGTAPPSGRSTSSRGSYDISVHHMIWHEETTIRVMGDLILLNQ